MCVGLHGWNVTVDPYCSQLSICQAKLASSFFLPDSLAPSLACYCHPKKNFSEGLTKKSYRQIRFPITLTTDSDITSPRGWIIRYLFLFLMCAEHLPSPENELIRWRGPKYWLLEGSYSHRQKSEKKVQTYVIQTQSGKRKMKDKKVFFLEALVINRVVILIVRNCWRIVAGGRKNPLWKSWL